MSVKEVQRYSLLGYADGTSRVNLYFSDGGEAYYTGLAPDRAALLTDLLRNEKPLYWNPTFEILFTGREDVGEGEHAFDLTKWLEGRPGLSGDIRWWGPGREVRSFEEWEPRQQAQLRAAIRRLLVGDASGIPDLPRLVNVPAGNEHARSWFSPTDCVKFSSFRRPCIAAHVLEVVNWSLDSLTSDQRRLLLDSNSLFFWDNSQGENYRVDFYVHGASTPSDPVGLFRFLNSNQLLGPTTRDTIERLLNWCRAELHHFTGGWESDNVFRKWEYRGYPPPSKVIGTGLTACCWGTVAFLRSILRTANVPVELVRRGGHAQPGFVREKLYLSHGDDPYSQNMDATPPIPIGLLLIDQQKHESWFGNSLSEEEIKNNIGRRSTELGLQYLSDFLLRRKTTMSTVEWDVRRVRSLLV